MEISITKNGKEKRFFSDGNKEEVKPSSVPIFQVKINGVHVNPISDYVERKQNQEKKYQNTAEDVLKMATKEFKMPDLVTANRASEEEKPEVVIKHESIDLDAVVPTQDEAETKEELSSSTEEHFDTSSKFIRNDPNKLTDEDLLSKFNIDESEFEEDSFERIKKGNKEFR